ncbi:rRNA pseudouridine synthase [Clostridiaceae bacterium]|jgi:16S rRNA pseudouridine516 synthase|nr:rRNA pseudouridine synthase [Clostridiaceae bacterium]
MGKSMRLDKFLTEMKCGSRSEVKERIRRGSVCVDGQPVLDPGFRVDPEEMRVALNGETVGWAETEYYMLNKPQGVVSATEDSLHTTVVDLIADSRRKDLFPVGRLDIDTEGLLLITNDGALAHRLLSPNRKVDKVYLAHVTGRLPADVVERFAEGLTLKDGTALRPASLTFLKNPEEAGAAAEVLLTIREGKFHQVKRMFEAVGGTVVYLKRVSMGPLSLDKALKPGQYRALTEDELSRLAGMQSQKAGWGGV